MLRKSHILTFGVAIISVMVAIMMRILWRPLLDIDSPFLFFFSALALAAWYGGLYPGILSTLLGALSVGGLGLLPITRGGTVDIPHLLQFSLFIVTGVLISFLMERLHAALDRSAEAERVLEQRVQERTEELVHANRALQQLSSELLNAQEAERLRISKELHDELGQALTLVKLKIGLVDMNLDGAVQPSRKYCEDAAAHVDQAIENMRRLSRDLSPVTVETLGITIALRRLSNEFNAAGGIRITAEIAPVDDLLPLGAAILLYRIIQEALNNIVKHSGANNAVLSIRSTEDGIHVEVKDDGRGMDSNKTDVKPGSRGLTIMTERVRTLGGSLEIQSREGSGTLLQFTIPATTERKENPSHNSLVSAPAPGI
jgi:signal transduction histidine kinase